MLFCINDEALEFNSLELNVFLNFQNVEFTKLNDMKVNSIRNIFIDTVSYHFEIKHLNNYKFIYSLDEFVCNCLFIPA